MMHEVISLGVIDGDTVLVNWHGQPQPVRLAHIDTEETQDGSGKPVTDLGRAAKSWLSRYLPRGCRVILQFDGDEVETDRYQRLLCYLWKNSTNVNLELVSLGYSPYFPKYGHSRKYRSQFEEIQSEAIRVRRGIWSRSHRGRNYGELLHWWDKRAEQVEKFRRNADGVLLPGTKDCDNVCPLITGSEATIFVDFQGARRATYSNGTAIKCGATGRPFAIWFPRPEDEIAIATIREKFTCRGGCGYGFVSGEVRRYRGRWQLVAAGNRISG